MPSSTKDRFTVDFEYVFFFTKNKRYYFEQQFEPLATTTLPRMLRGVSENNKWVNGADGQTKHTMSQPRENKGKLYGTNYGGDWKCNRGHSGYFRADGKPLFDIEKGRNMRSVWKVSTKGFPEAHFATFPETLIEPMIKAGCPEFICSKCGKPRERIIELGNIISRGGSDHGKMAQSKDSYVKNARWCKSMEQREHIPMGYTDCGCNAGFDGGIVYDPFMGAGTVAVVAKRLNRHYLGSELNPEYTEIAERRLKQPSKIKRIKQVYDSQPKITNKKL